MKWMLFSWSNSSTIQKSISTGLLLAEKVSDYLIKPYRLQTTMHVTSHSKAMPTRFHQRHKTIVTTPGSRAGRATSGEPTTLELTTRTCVIVSSGLAASCRQTHLPNGVTLFPSRPPSRASSQSVTHHHGVSRASRSTTHGATRTHCHLLMVASASCVRQCRCV